MKKGKRLLQILLVLMIGAVSIGILFANVDRRKASIKQVETKPIDSRGEEEESEEEKARRETVEDSRSEKEKEEKLEQYMTEKVLAPMQEEMQKAGMKDMRVEIELSQASGGDYAAYRGEYDFYCESINAEFETAIKKGKEKQFLQKFEQLLKIKKKYVKIYEIEIEGSSFSVDCGAEVNDEDDFIIRYPYCVFNTFPDGSESLFDHKDHEIELDEKGKVTLIKQESTSVSKSKSSSTSRKKEEKKYTKTYDDGYEDVWLDEDYDEDEYLHNSDYANGVDDAMEEFGDF